MELLFQLISGGAGGNGEGAGSSGSRDAMVKEACDYYRANEDFTAEQLFALKSAFPNRSLKEITELCADGEVSCSQPTYFFFTKLNLATIFQN